MKVLLLRGINVGGNHKLPMKDLVEILDQLGCRNIATYIQSGNAVFEGAVSSAAISDAISDSKSFRPSALILEADVLRLIARANPYPEATADGKSLHVWFTYQPAHFDDSGAKAVKAPSERYHVTDRAIYLHAPDGIGRSKLAEKMGKLAGVEMTARNWNTVAKLLEMIEA